MAESSGSEIVFSMECAETAFLTGDFELALKHLFGCMVMLSEERRPLYEEQFAAALHGWVALDKRFAPRALALYPQIKKLFPNTIQTKMALIRAVQGHRQSHLLLKCLPICIDAQELATRTEDIVDLRMTRINLAAQPFPSDHIRRVNCHIRNEAYFKALQQSIKNRLNTVVVIGSGTGLVPMMAARSTYSVVGLEKNIPLAMISREIIKRNGMSERIQIHADSSTNYKPSQKADVIVSEELDCCVFGNGLVESFKDARKRFATEDTVFIPNKATLYVQLFSSREIYDIHAQNYDDMRCRSKYVRTDNTHPERPYWSCDPDEFCDFEYLSMPEELHTAYFGTPEGLESAMCNSGMVRLSPTDDGVAHGFAVHFTADLTGDGVCINSAESERWGIGIFPFKEPLDVKLGVEIPVKWQQNGERLDLINMFYTKKQDREYMQQNSFHYKKASIHSILMLRSTLYYKQMIAEIDEAEWSYTEDLTDLVPIQLRLEAYGSRKNAKVIVANWTRADGTLDQDSFFQIEQIVSMGDHIRKITPSKIRIIGQLFYSDHVHHLARPDESAHCGLDLSMLRSFNLREMRDIRITERDDIETTSDEFTLFEFEFNVDAFRHNGLPTTSREIEVRTTDRICDGVIYEFEILGVNNSTLRPCAAFLFPERHNCDQKVTLVCDYHKGQILVTLKDHTY